MTTVGRWRTGTRINLERPLKIGDELGGHMVSGHVDGLADVVAREDMTDMARFTLRVPHALARFIAPKGSVALDGVSLTVNEVGDDTLLGADHPAHAPRHDASGALKAGDADQSRNRHDGALRRAADGNALTGWPLLRRRSACY